MTPTTQQNDGVSLRAYLHVVARWKWLVAGLTILGLVGAYGYSLTRTPMYQAAAQLMYDPQVNVADLSSSDYVDPTQRRATLESVATVLASTRVEPGAKAALGADSSAPFTVSAEPQLAKDNSGSFTSIVFVTAISPSRRVAASAANAYAQAFVDWRMRRERGRLQQAATVIDNALSKYTTSESRLTAEYLGLQQQLRNVEMLKQTATGSFSVIIEAAPPPEPFSPQPLRNGAIGLAGGMLLALIIAFVLEQLDTRVRSDERIVQMLALPILARIPRIDRKDVKNGNLLVTLDQPTSPTAEAFRVLRTNLDFLSVDGPVCSVLITSSAQREGKSVCACNLAVSLALSGKRVVLIDGDLRNPHVHIYFGLSNAVGLSSLLVHGTPPAQVLQRVSLQPAARAATALRSRTAVLGARDAQAADRTVATPSADSSELTWASDRSGLLPLHVLTSGAIPPNPGELIASANLDALIENLSQHADLVLVDAPAMLAVSDTAALAPRVDGLLYVVDADVVRRPMLQRAAEQLQQLPCRKFGLVVATDRAGDHYSYHNTYRKTDNRRRNRAKR